MDDLMCSCVILNYNDAETTIKLVNKISAYRCLRYIIIVDNCSTDNSWYDLDVVRNNEKVMTINTDKNGGYGYGNNYGVRYAYNRLNETCVLIVNPDVDFSEECLLACIQALKRGPERAIVSPVQMDANGKRVRQYAWNLESGMHTLLSNEFFMRHTLFPLPCADVDFSNDEVLIDCIPGSFLLVDAKKFLQAGGYHEGIFLYYEEITLASRMCKNGWKTVLLPGQTYLHLHSVSISKNIPQIVNRRRIQYESLLIYLEDVCKYGKIRLFMAKCFLKFCLFEEKMIAFIKLRMRKAE